MADVFLSYSRRDTEFAQEFSSFIQNKNYSIWDVGEQGRYREGFQIEIRKQLEDARLVIVLWSDEAIHSEWVKHEADIALKLGKYVGIKLPHASFSRLPPPWHKAVLYNYEFAREDFEAFLRRVMPAKQKNSLPRALNRSAPVPLLFISTIFLSCYLYLLLSMNLIAPNVVTKISTDEVSASAEGIILSFSFSFSALAVLFLAALNLLRRPTEGRP